MYTIFLSFGLRPEWYFDSKFLIGIIAIAVGVGGAAVLFFFLNMFVEGLPQKASLALIPYAYLLPGFGLMSLMLLYPAVRTIQASFANEDTTAYVGLENYRTIFGEQGFRDRPLQQPALADRGACDHRRARHRGRGAGRQAVQAR